MFLKHALGYNQIQNTADCAIARKGYIYYNEIKVNLRFRKSEKGEKEYENY